MFACQHGFLDIVKCLVKHGARVEARDRFKRTPLIHACMYGHAHVVSYLLRIGANPNAFDSSMNSALHYAIAYGWYFCVRLLLQAGAKINIANRWRVTCLEIGFSKGHYGICDYLLNEHQANINFKNDEGQTIVMLIVDLDVSESSVERLGQVVVKHNANCTCVDVNGSNAFHYLAEKSSTSSKDHYFRMAQILLDHHCSPTQMNNKAQTPLMLALESKNVSMVDFFINQAKVELTLDINGDGKTFLHYFAMNSDDEKLVEILLNLPVTGDLKKMSLTSDNQRKTPFDYCTSKYEELFGNRYYGSCNRLSQYQSIIKMIRYFIDILECFSETCIFHLLYETPYSSQFEEHPLEIFLRKSKNINVLHPTTEQTPLLKAIVEKYHNIVTLLLKEPSCDVNFVSSEKSSGMNLTPLMIACKLQRYPVIRDLLNHPKCDLLAYDAEHNQALHHFLTGSSRSDDYLEVFHLFIEKLIAIDNDTLNLKGKSGSTPLHIAVFHNPGIVETINVVEQTLIDNGCDLFAKDDLGNIPLHNVFLGKTAISLNQLNLALRLIATVKNRAVLEEKTSHGQNLLHIINLNQISDASFFDKFLTHFSKHNLDWNAPDDYGMYPLHYACIVQNKTFIGFFQKKYPTELDLNRTDQYGNTAYGLLFWNSNRDSSFDKEFLRTVFISGKSLDCLCNYDNRTERNPLSFEIISTVSRKAVARTPLDLENASTIIRTSPLINAIIHHNFELAKFILELGADVNFPDEQRLTPLMYAIQQNDLNMVKLLLNKDYAINSGDKSSKKNLDSDEEHMNQSNKFQLTSNIDLNATDALGRTCVHYLTQPFPNVSYTNNDEILELLRSVDASLFKEPMDTENLTNHSFIVNDPNKDLLGVTDYYSDAQQYISQYMATHPIDKTNSIYKVDPLSNMNETGEIVWDTDKNEPYDVRLTITDIDHGLISLYNFYRMQVIKHRTKTSLYLLFTRWGRIGDGNGQYQSTPYPSFEECRAEFCKIFQEKTGNAWENTNQFEKKLKKYTLIQLSDNQTQNNTDVPIDFERLNDEAQQVPSKLKSDEYKDLFRTFLNSEAIRKKAKEATSDLAWMPLSQLRPESLQKARDVLEKLKSDIEQKEKLQLLIQQTISDENTEFGRLLDSICQLTNEYYSLIPLPGYDDEKLPIIDTLQAVKLQEQKLTDIFELELSYKILLAAQANLNQISPLDYLYKSINCQFEVMNQNDVDYGLILRYIWASVPGTKVEQIFKFARPNDDERRFQRNLDNHYLLWHGTNICNSIGILTRGLLIAPLCAKSTGSIFGKGIYTADAFVKSLNYCSGVTKSDGERCIMLLCEVALGKSEEISDESDDQDEPLDFDEYQSRKGHGRSIPDPRYTITRDGSIKMPLGRLISCEEPKHSSHSFKYNEYIVFDESQIAIRYIVQFLR
ncbi:unnamed protein product [Rotaria sp. Silwood1]|nr:unnamed protein product [Rotaria sp. Silwood1]